MEVSWGRGLLDWAGLGTCPLQCHLEVTTTVKVLPAVPGWLQGMLRAMEGVSKKVLGEERAGGRSWPSVACDACATLVRPRAAGVSQKEVPAPDPTSCGSALQPLRRRGTGQCSRLPMDFS